MRGSCLCGKVTWQFDGSFDGKGMSHCHCSMCRKSHGSPFATFVGDDKSRFRWLSGNEEVTAFRSSDDLTRYFCSSCGSPVAAGTEQRIAVPAGLFDEEPPTRPTMHIFVADKAPWFDIEDQLPQHEFWPQSMPRPVVETHRPEKPTSSALCAGSCLCGAVEFEVSEPFKQVFMCHCLRCRKARGAAHGCNGFTSTDALNFRKGEDLLKTFKLPEAQFFAQAFCTICGSAMPRKDPQRGVAIIPFGSLDSEPNLRPQQHIFVDSKAPWFEVEGELPRSPAAPA